MARISLAEVTEGTLGVLLRGAPSAVVESFSIDTRSMKPGDLFFALVGPNHDAHRFVADAIRGKAAAVVIARGRPNDFEGSAAVIRVADTHRALQDLGGWVRRRGKAKVIGITGSAGKTTTKEMTAAIFEEAMPTFKSMGNFNNLYGLPLSLLSLEETHRAAVLEMGMSFPGELARLTEIADPDVGILTNVCPAHMENFDSLSSIADAKGELFRGMGREGVAVYNADDEEATRVALPFPGRKIGFGFGEKADVRATDISSTSDGSTRFRLRGLGEDRELEIPFPGRHHVANALAAAAGALASEVPGDAVGKGLARTQPLPMRGSLLRFKKDVRVLDESYNSNPRAMEQTLATLAHLPATRRLVAAGDMLELGAIAEEAHRALGEQVAGAGAAIFLAVGELCKFAADSARKAGLSEVHHFEGAAAAGEWLLSRVQAGDLVLVKGSRGIGMEQIVESLRTSLGMEES